MTASASQLTLHPKQNFISAILAILSFFWEWFLIFLLRFGILLLVTLVTHCGTTRMYYAKSECLVLLWCFHTAKSCIRLVWNQHKHNIFSLPPKKAFWWGGGRVPKQTDLWARRCRCMCHRHRSPGHYWRCDRSRHNH